VRASLLAGGAGRGWMQPTCRPDEPERPLRASSVPNRLESPHRHWRRLFCSACRFRAGGAPVSS